MSKLTMLVFTLLFSTCKSIDYLYYYDTPSKIGLNDKIPSCAGLTDLIKKNFLYNAKDSLYLLNTSFLYQIRVADYHDCFEKLTPEQLVQLFGPPSTYYSNGFPAYFDNYLIDKRNRSGSYWAGFRRFSKVEHPLQDMLGQSDNFKKAKGFIKAGNFVVEGGDFKKECMERKQNFAEQVFIHKKSGIAFVSSTLTYLTKDISDMRTGINCNETFTKNEIDNLFGKPHLMSGDTLFFQTIDTPFMNRNGRKPEWKGKVFCVIFYKSGFKDYYKYDTQMVDPKRLER